MNGNDKTEETKNKISVNDTKQAKIDAMDKQEVCDHILKFRNNFEGATKYIGIELTEVTAGRAKGQIMIEKHHVNPIGSVHGGIIFALADTVGGVAAWTHGHVVTTANGTVHFLNAARNVKKITAEAVELKAGKKLLVYDVYVRDEQDRLLSKLTMEYYNLQKPIPIV